VHAARALGCADLCGRLEVGRQADFALWNIDSLAELVYWSGMKRCTGVVFKGVYKSSDNLNKGSH
jgi:imidazolonepropionase